MVCAESVLVHGQSALHALESLLDLVQLGQNQRQNIVRLARRRVAYAEMLLADQNDLLEHLGGLGALELVELARLFVTGLVHLAPAVIGLESVNPGRQMALDIPGSACCRGCICGCDGRRVWAPGPRCRSVLLVTRICLGLRGAQEAVPDVGNLVEHRECALELALLLENEAHLVVPWGCVDVLGPHGERRVVHTICEMMQRSRMLALRNIQCAKVAVELRLERVRAMWILEHGPFRKRKILLRLLVFLQPRCCLRKQQIRRNHLNALVAIQLNRGPQREQRPGNRMLELLAQQRACGLGFANFNHRALRGEPVGHMRSTLLFAAKHAMHGAQRGNIGAHLDVDAVPVHGLMVCRAVKCQFALRTRMGRGLAAQLALKVLALGCRKKHWERKREKLKTNRKEGRPVFLPFFLIFNEEWGFLVQTTAKKKPK
eukprot:comp19071_c0_seq1/m.35353 comp19071_c0_seq1/g.35353  ORF comp19071_c0_seq1/g.35353 comp19071_c0_seq1/m.35353 type:complete len:431 (+) comp19071_c0_seq1:87-1379(+)